MLRPAIDRLWRRKSFKSLNRFQGISYMIWQTFGQNLLPKPLQRRRVLIALLRHLCSMQLCAGGQVESKSLYHSLTRASWIVLQGNIFLLCISLAWLSLCGWLICCDSKATWARSHGEHDQRGCRGGISTQTSCEEFESCRFKSFRSKGWCCWWSGKSRHLFAESTWRLQVLWAMPRCRQCPCSEHWLFSLIFLPRLFHAWCF